MRLSNPIFFTVAAGVKKLCDSLSPTQRGSIHQFLCVYKNPWLLEVKCLYDEGLFCGKKRIEECARDSYRLVDLFHSRMLYSLFRQELKAFGEQRLSHLRLFRFRISDLWHFILLKIKTNA